MQTTTILRNSPVLPTEISALRAKIGWEDLEDRFDSALKNTYATFSVRENGALIGFAG